MSSRAAYDRLRKEYIRLQKSPVPHIVAAPLDSDILVWWYVLVGPADSPYAGGVYLGKLTFPPQYPFKPPSIQMHTPSGRFKPDTRLCLSMSDFHPESWNPLWSVGSILAGLLSFMLESTPTQGSVDTDDHTKRELARRSGEFNRRNPIYKKLFPQFASADPKEVEAAMAAVAGVTSAAAATSAQRGQSASAIPAAAAAAASASGSSSAASAAAPAASTSAVALPAAGSIVPPSASAAAAAAAAAGAAAPPAAAAVTPAASAPSGPSPKTIRVFGLCIREDQLFDYAFGTLVVLSAVFGAIYWQIGNRTTAQMP